MTFESVFFHERVGCGGGALAPSHAGYGVQARSPETTGVEPLDDEEEEAPPEEEEELLPGGSVSSVPPLEDPLLDPHATRSIGTDARSAKGRRRMPSKASMRQTTSPHTVSLRILRC
jgi:hypothetical protein